MGKKSKEKRNYDHQLTKHHKQCRSNGGKDGKENISYVPRIQHIAWHTMFSNLLPPTICHILNHKWLDGRWKFICVQVDNYDKVKKLAKHLIEE
jgi:hypothetical protein